MPSADVPSEFRSKRIGSFLRGFFFEKPSGKIYSSENIVTSFDIRGIIQLGGSSTQVHEAFDINACRASSWATWLDSLSQCSIEISANSLYKL